jgi:hypothetical protein
MMAFALRQRIDEEDYILPRKPVGKRVFGRLINGLKDNVRMDFKEMVEFIWINSEYVPVAGSCDHCTESSRAGGEFL